VPARVGATALLYLVLGDGVASLAGKGLKGPRWFRSDKRISGSVACFLMCAAAGAALLRPDMGWGLILAGAAAATLIEMGPVPLNDNLVIPAGSALVWALLTHARPLFFWPFGG
jgi:dolichol kinase